MQRDRCPLGEISWWQNCALLVRWMEGVGAQIWWWTIYCAEDSIASCGGM